jgi:hypothetical protein
MSGVVQFIINSIKLGIVLMSLGYLKPVTVFLLTETIRLNQQPQFKLSKFNKALIGEKYEDSKRVRKSVHDKKSK